MPSGSPEAEQLTQKPTPNAEPVDMSDVRYSAANGTGSVGKRLMWAVIVILIIFLFVATGMAIYYGTLYQCCSKGNQTRESTDDLKSMNDSVFDRLLDTPVTQKRNTRNVRLPYNVLPRFYDLKLQVHLHDGPPSDFHFNGSVEVKMFCHESTSSIFIHSYLTLNVSLEQIKVQLWDSSSTTGDTLPIANTTYDIEMQWYRIEMVEPLEKGEFYRVLFGQFRSQLKTELKGWYLSSYKEKGVEKYLATSQLQPTDARRVFPCLDEPAFKAQFKVTLIRNKAYHSLSNMGLNHSETLPNDWVADVFQPTVNTSTYLLAFVVSQFESISGVESKNRKFNVWARPEVVHTAKYALETGQKIIRFFEEYFEVPYPLEKTEYEFEYNHISEIKRQPIRRRPRLKSNPVLSQDSNRLELLENGRFIVIYPPTKHDMIAVPDFAAGAMENWGLMIYREATMLWDPETGTASGQQKVATVVSHEIAHQWFGNLVTLYWWDDLWLNEGFASFAEAIGVDHVHPEWGMDEQFLLADIQKVLISDSLPSSRPVFQAVHFPNEINDIFDPISYNKGASVLRMMESFMGRDAFRLGLKNYLSAYKFKNTVHDDLWRSLTEAANSHGQDLDIKSIMDTWLMQMNYPLITVKRIEDRLFSFTQTHYLEPPDAKAPRNPSPYNFQWQVPLTYGTPKMSNWEKNPIIWLKDKSMTTTVEIDPTSWYVFNIKQAGFYRVHYADSNWEKLTEQLMKNHSVIPLQSRTQIIDDLFNLVNRGTVSYNVFLNLTKYLKNEDEFVAWETTRRAFCQMFRMFSTDSTFGLLQAHIRGLVNSALLRVDWTTMQEDENHMTHLLRGSITRLACQVGHKACVQKAISMYAEWMNNNATNKIPPSLRTTVYCTGIQWGGQLEWQFLRSQMQSKQKDDDMIHIRSALACTRDIWVMKDYLDSLLRPSDMEPTDLLDTVTYIAQNPIGHMLMWDRIRESMRRVISEKTSDQKERQLDSAVLIMLKILSKRLYTMNDIPHPEEILEFERLSKKQMEKHIFRRGFRDMVKRADQNKRWTDTHRKIIQQWLRDNIPDVRVLL